MVDFRWSQRADREEMEYQDSIEHTSEWSGRVDRDEREIVVVSKRANGQFEVRHEGEFSDRSRRDYTGFYDDEETAFQNAAYLRDVIADDYLA